MSLNEPDIDRRTLLQTAGGLAVAQVAQIAQVAQAQAAPAAAAAATKAPPGKPGDFDFLTGEWKIKHRRLKTADPNSWDEFAGEATCWTVLGGVGSIEELRIPARDFAGIGIRLLDVKERVWSDFWVNGKSGVLTTPGMTGAFEAGVGTFSAEDMDGDKPIQVRGVWDRITPTSCRWHQATSNDGGKSWLTSWLMDWQRA
jgi:hypothetical protein